MHFRFSTILYLTLVCVLSACMALAPTSGGTFTVVSDFPMDGATLPQTQSLVNAISLAFEQKNFKVCHNKWKITYRAYNNATYPSGKWEKDLAVKNANEFAKNTNVVAVIGGYNADITALTLPILSAENLLLISPTLTAPNPNPEAQANKLISLLPTDTAQSLRAVQWAKTLNVQTILIVADPELSGQSAGKSFAQAAQAQNLRLVGHEILNPTTPDYKPLAQKIQQAAPHLIYYAGSMPNQAARFIKDVREAGYKGLILGTRTFVDSGFLKESGDTAEGVYAVVGGLTLDQPTNWREAYLAKFQIEPESGAIYGYVAGEMLIEAFERLCQNGKLPTDRAAVRETVGGLREFLSVAGKLSVEATGEITPQIINGVQIKQGKLEAKTLPLLP